MASSEKQANELEISRKNLNNELKTKCEEFKAELITLKQTIQNQCIQKPPNNNPE